jgi:hypothetical protein
MAITTSAATVDAKAFLDACSCKGFRVEVQDNVVTVLKNFEPGSLEEFARCDFEAPLLLMMVPLSGGSIWGTDGASVGGWSAVQDGKFKLHKSGYRAKRFINALMALVK